MKWINIALLVVVVFLQSRIWHGEGSMAQISVTEEAIAVQQFKNKKLDQRNNQLRIEVQALKHGLDSVEARARRDLGLIREGETFFFVLN